MTNAEAIEQLRTIPTNMVERVALTMAIDALREKADKERRFVVVGSDLVQYRVIDTERELGVADRIPTREAAQAIADIYEGMHE